MKIELEIIKAQLIISSGPDSLSLQIKAPTAFPNLGYEPFVRMDIAQGHGKEYCNTVFHIDPEIIDVRPPRRNFFGRKKLE